ncbi:hypothetical protein PanWU01x14_158290 [Parasponia andersonii]|uniref:Uncharacterized protein n=1 Tax=Parasponia andersonii TaxID=3476 RepID=A0A2P5CF06_PARAD|nr:hypothetical protein PanWU01x14_158290 [Parasponia andersonii]
MEGIPSPNSTSGENNEGLLSCWGCLKLKVPWKRRTRRYTTARHVRGSIVGKSSAADFRYDPLSYAQNFDEGWDEDDSELSRRGFSARFVAPLSKPLQDE